MPQLVYLKDRELRLRSALTQWQTLMIKEWQYGIKLTSNHCSRKPARTELSSTGKFWKRKPRQSEKVVEASFPPPQNTLLSSLSYKFYNDLRVNDYKTNRKSPVHRKVVYVLL